MFNVKKNQGLFGQVQIFITKLEQYYLYLYLLFVLSICRSDLEVSIKRLEQIFIRFFGRLLHMSYTFALLQKSQSVMRYH